MCRIMLLMLWYAAAASSSSNTAQGRKGSKQVVEIMKAVSVRNSH